MILKIFEGEYPQGSWPIERVRRLVEAYDPVNGIEAPAVVGHMDNVLVERLENELAYGWVKALSTNEAGEVFADIPNEEISPQLKTWITDRNLRYVSAEIAERDLKEAETPPYLVRVAFLGRSIPAVNTARVPSLFRKLLEVVGFGRREEAPSDGVQMVHFCRRLPDGAVGELLAMAAVAGAGSAAANAELNTASASLAGKGPAAFQSGMEVSTMGEKELQEEVARLKAENGTQANKLKLFAAAENDAKASAAKKDAEAYYGALRDSGKLTPAKFEKAVSVDIVLGEKERESLRALFAKDEVTPVIGLGREHVATGDRTDGEKPLSGSLVKEIQSFAKKEKISYEDAARRLHEERPALFGQEG